MRELINPSRLERMLEEAQKEYDKYLPIARRKGSLADEWDYLADISMEINELKHMIAVAWADDEWDACNETISCY